MKKTSNDCTIKSIRRTGPAQSEYSIERDQTVYPDKIDPGILRKPTGLTRGNGPVFTRGWLNRYGTEGSKRPVPSGRKRNVFLIIRGTGQLFYNLFLFIRRLFVIKEKKIVINKIEEISYWIESNSSEIIGNLEQESIDVYQFLKNEFENSNIIKNHLFQFVFRSFYRMDNAGLTPEFKDEYFKILEENRNEKQFDFNKVLKRLYLIKNRKGQNTLQFSFATKLFNIIDDTLPIYDSEVARMFSFSRPYQSDFDVKLNKYLEQFNMLQKGYAQILKLNLIPETNRLFDKKFVNHGLSETKKLDFIFWSAGKIKNKKNN